MRHSHVPDRFMLFLSTLPTHNSPTIVLQPRLKELPTNVTLTSCSASFLVYGGRLIWDGAWKHAQDGPCKPVKPRRGPPCLRVSPVIKIEPGVVLVTDLDVRQRSLGPDDFPICKRVNVRVQAQGAVGARPRVRSRPEKMSCGLGGVELLLRGRT